MTYLTAYRSQSAKYGDGVGKAFKLPRPYKPVTKPLGANDNSPRPANDNIRKARWALRLAGRIKALGRLNPYLNLALNGYELYRLTQAGAVQSASPFALPPTWVMQHVCVPDPCGHPSPTGGWRTPSGVPWLQYLAGSGPFAVVTDAHITGIPGNSFTSFSSVGTVARVIGWYYDVDFPPGTQTAAYSFYAYRPRTASQTNRWRLRNYYTPPPAPVFDPHLLPIKQVMNLPLPVPMEVVNNRVNEELGSQRNNGDVKPRFVVRRPPEKGTKETKLRGLAPFIGAVQGAFHAVTEGLDALDALHNALPKQYQAKAVMRNGKWWNASPQAKAEALYRNYDKVDWNEAVKNLIVNHYVDKFIGSVSGGAKRGLDNTPIGRIVGGRAVFGGF